MFSFLKNSAKEISINSNQALIPAKTGESILHSALEHSLNFPHNCRVGACGQCKCRLLQGKVKELTESAYILSAEELQQGYILACQSIPKTDIEIEVATEIQTVRTFSAEKVMGKIIQRERLTSDIVAIEIQLEKNMPFIAGQYAELSIPGIIDEARAYSFATVAEDSKATFYVREMPNGEMSNYLNTGDILNKSVLLNGPFGDFYLRPAESPFICIAGGSGLAPIKALLEDAFKNNVKRAVTLMFGARTEADLYCLKEIQQLSENWPEVFNFVPVLSDDDNNLNWQGERGFMNPLLKKYIDNVEQIYLCGPPVMIDSMMTELKFFGIDNNNIYFDKFTDKSALSKN